MAIKDKVQELAQQRGKHEGIDKDERLQDPTDRFYNNFAEYAMHKCAYYECYKCKSPYFGGLADCENEAMRAADSRQ